MLPNAIVPAEIAELLMAFLGGQRTGEIILKINQGRVCEIVFTEKRKV